MMMMMCNQTVNVFVVSKKWVLDEQTTFFFGFWSSENKERERKKRAKNSSFQLNSKDDERVFLKQLEMN